MRTQQKDVPLLISSAVCSASACTVGFSHVWALCRSGSLGPPQTHLQGRESGGQRWDCKNACPDQGKRESTKLVPGQWASLFVSVWGIGVEGHMGIVVILTISFLNFRAENMLREHKEKLKRVS